MSTFLSQHLQIVGTIHVQLKLNQTFMFTTSQWADRGSMIAAPLLLMKQSLRLKYPLHVRTATTTTTRETSQQTVELEKWLVNKVQKLDQLIALDGVDNGNNDVVGPSVSNIPHGLTIKETHFLFLALDEHYEQYILRHCSDWILYLFNKLSQTISSMNTYCQPDLGLMSYKEPS